MQTLYDKIMGVRNDCQSWLIYSPTNIVHYQKITILSKKNGKVLIDALLYSGLDQYRFIEMNIDENGKIITDKYNYVILDQALEKTANDIIKKHPIQLKNSILTQSQIDQILNN